MLKIIFLSFGFILLQANTIIFNAKVYTVNKDQPYADALAINQVSFSNKDR